MNEVLKPIYESVEKILKGEEIGTVNIGVSDAFNQVSKEFIGYGCFGEVISNALLINLEDKILHFKQDGIVKTEEMCLSSGIVENDIDVAYELSQILFPTVFCLVHENADGVLHVVDAMWAFVPCNKYDLNNVFDILGESFKKEYKSWYADNVPTTTEKLYENIVKILPF